MVDFNTGAQRHRGALKPYSEYRETGLAWLPTVPKGWRVLHIRELFTERREKVSDKMFAPLSVSRQGVVPQLENVALSEDGENRKRVHIGDFVINSRSDRKASSGISKYDGSVSLINIVMKPRSEVCGGYTHYLLKCHDFVEEYYRNGRGIVSDLWTTRYDEMKAISLPVPPPDEQRAIVAYLDEKTAKMDRLIALKEREVALLNEKKQAMISRVVTRGLDPNAELVDSGVDWIGKVPKGWRVERLKNIADYMNDGDWINADIITGSGVRYLTSGNVGAGVFKPQGSGYVSHETFTSLGFTKAFPGDLLISRLNEPIGRSCVVPSGEPFYVVAVDNVIFRCKDFCVKEYVNYAMNCAGYAQSALELASGATMKRISRSKLSRLSIPVPPPDEQRAIVAYLDEKTAKMDRLIALKEREVALLNEKKQAMISRVVTRGLDPNAELVDSGVDWIGKVPKGWRKNKVLRCFELIGSGTTPTSGEASYFDNGTIPWVNSGDVYGRGTYFDSASRNITQKALDNYSVLRMYPPNTIVIAMYGGSIGNMSVATFSFCCNQACCCLANINGSLDLQYVYSVLSSAKAYWIQESSGGGQPNISQEKIRQTWIPVPPLAEQRAIVAYLDEATAKIDRAVAAIERSIELLKERKTRLVSDVVTGKVDVRYVSGASE